MSMTIKILSGGAMRPLMAQLVPRFEHAHGMTIDIEFRLTAALKHAIAAGAAFDIAILPRPDLNDLIEQGGGRACRARRSRNRHAADRRHPAGSGRGTCGSAT